MKYYKKELNGRVTEIPEYTKNVWCNNNNLTALELPKVVKFAHCGNNKLTELELPKGVKFVHCDYIKDISKQFNKVENKIEIYI